MIKMNIKKISAILAAITLITAAPVSVYANEIEPAEMTYVSQINAKKPAPKGIKAKVSGNTVTFSWKSVKGADKYNLYYYDSKTKKYKLYKSVRGTTCKVDGLADGTYYFKISAGGTKSARIDIKISYSSAWVNGYKKAIKNFTARADFPNEVMCSLYDITGDGIPELFISGGDYHYMGAEIYSWQGGSLKQFSWISDYNGETFYNFGEYGQCMYYPETGLICSQYAGMGDCMMSFYKYKNGKLVKVFTAEYDNHDPDVVNLLINGEKISRAEYDEAIKPYQGKSIYLGRAYATKDGQKDYDGNAYMKVDTIFDMIVNEGYDPADAHVAEDLNMFYVYENLD